MKEIEILYLRSPIHPDIAVIRVGPGIERIELRGASYWITGTEDGPLSGRELEIPKDNVAGVQWVAPGSPDA